MAASTIAGRPFQTALTLGQIFLPTRSLPGPCSTTAPIASNISIEEGQRIDVKTAYVDTASSLQRWFSPEVEIRPDVTTRRSMQMRRKGSSSLQIVPNRNFVRYGPPGAA